MKYILLTLLLSVVIVVFSCTVARETSGFTLSVTSVQAVTDSTFETYARRSYMIYRAKGLKKRLKVGERISVKPCDCEYKKNVPDSVFVRIK